MFKKLESGCIIEEWILKIPIAFLILSGILFVLSFTSIFFNNIFTIFDTFLKNQMFTSTRISQLINVSVVLIGFYMTIMSIFGSNPSQAIVNISKGGLSRKFISYIKNSLLSTFIFFIVTIFFDFFTSKFFVLIYGTIFLWVLMNMIRMTYITIKLYGYNISNANKALAEKNKQKREMLSLLQEIKDLHDKNSIEYYNNIKESVQKQKENAKDIPYDEDI